MSCPRHREGIRDHKRRHPWFFLGLCILCYFPFEGQIAATEATVKDVRARRSIAIGGKWRRAFWVSIYGCGIFPVCTWAAKWKLSFPRRFGPLPPTESARARLDDATPKAVSFRKSCGVETPIEGGEWSSFRFWCPNYHVHPSRLGPKRLILLCSARFRRCFCIWPLPFAFLAALFYSRGSYFCFGRKSAIPVTTPDGRRRRACISGVEKGPRKRILFTFFLKGPTLRSKTKKKQILVPNGVDRVLEESRFELRELIFRTSYVFAPCAISLARIPEFSKRTFWRAARTSSPLIPFGAIIFGQSEKGCFRLGFVSKILLFPDLGFSSLFRELFVLSTRNF